MLNLDEALERPLTINPSRFRPQGGIKDDGDASNVHGCCPGAWATDRSYSVSEQTESKHPVSHWLQSESDSGAAQHGISDEERTQCI